MKNKASQKTPSSELYLILKKLLSYWQGMNENCFPWFKMVLFWGLLLLLSYFKAALSVLVLWISNILLCPIKNQIRSSFWLNRLHSWINRPVISHISLIMNMPASFCMGTVAIVKVFATRMKETKSLLTDFCYLIFCCTECPYWKVCIWTTGDSLQCPRFPNNTPGQVWQHKKLNSSAVAILLLNE